MPDLSEKEIRLIIDAELERRRETRGLPSRWKLEALGWMAAIFLGLLAVAGFFFNDWVVGKIETAVVGAVTQPDKEGFGVLRDAVAKKVIDIPSFDKQVASAVLPEGALIIVDDKDGCPSGWKMDERSAGRFVVGVGGQTGLTAKRFRDIGGAETQEVPNHSHKISMAQFMFKKSIKMKARVYLNT